MLQGPHGPFFAELADMLRAGGHSVHRIGFNGGDRHFWRGDGYSCFSEGTTRWPGHMRRYIIEHKITDIVFYGDTRDRHVAAIEIGEDLGVRLHVFEEGYLRPYWVTYERNGVNGYSPLMNISVEEMREALTVWPRQKSDIPATWGELRQHIFYGLKYHAFVLAGMRRYAHYQSHRVRTIRAELRSGLKHLLRLPATIIRRYVAQRRIKRGSFTYSLVLLQLAHDASIQSHSSFRDMVSFIRLCLQEFAAAAPKNMHLVFKAHPLEDYFHPLAEYAKARAAQLGIDGRVHFVEGGKLATLLDSAHSVVTVNSTAAQQALWRGLPLKALGRAVYSKPSLVSDQSLQNFFADPQYPSREDYSIFRRFLLETSQIKGGFYTAKGRAMLIRSVVPWMLEDHSQYEKIFENLGDLANRRSIEQKRLKFRVVK